MTSKINKELYYEGMIGFLKTQGCTEEEFLAELTRGETTKEEYIEHLSVCIGNESKLVYAASKTFEHLSSLKDVHFWGVLYGTLARLPGTLKEKLLSFTSPKITKEEIFVLFLKKHRKFSLGVKKYKHFNALTLSNLTYRQLFLAIPTVTSKTLTIKWDKLTKALHITGNLNSNLILKGEK